MIGNEGDKIWFGDQLERRHEAKLIEAYITKEVQTFAKLGRDESLVLGVDAPYGRGKTWFLKRLSEQLRLSHPVAFIDAWADDVGDEPLSAFMAAIDDALAPYISKSKKLGDQLAAAKATALPILGKLASGATTKALTKIAGDTIEDELGEILEEAIRGAQTEDSSKEAGAAAQAMEAALKSLGKEIDSLVDRRGAALLADYRRRRNSRQIFKENMRALASVIDESDGPGSAPLIVVIDELDRCRPNYAIKMLEEIKHFFAVPNVVFIIGLHGDQLSKSVKAVYGTEFASDEYLRRFFTRRYRLKAHPIVELTASIWNEWGINEEKFVLPKFSPTFTDRYALTNARTIGLILSQWNTTPREIHAVMDGLRLFVDSWEYSEPIEPIALLSLLVRLTRGLDLNFVPEDNKSDIKFAGTAWTQNSGTPSEFSVADYLNALRRIAWTPLGPAAHYKLDQNPARNYIIEILKNEWNSRGLASRESSHSFQSYFAQYIPRIHDLAGFISDVEKEKSSTNYVAG